MWTILISLFWALAAVIALLLAVLACPVRFEVRASMSDALRYKVGLRPFGHFGPRVPIADSEKPSREKRTKSKKVKTGRKTIRNPRRLVTAALDLVTEILGQLHFEDVKLDIRFGAGDPSETGQIYGALIPLVYGCAGARRLRLNVEPVFDQAIFDGRAALDVSFTPLRLLPPFVRFGWAAFGPRR